MFAVTSPRRHWTAMGRHTNRFSQLCRVKVLLFQWKIRWIQKTELMTKTFSPSLGADVFLRNFCLAEKDYSKMIKKMLERTPEERGFRLKPKRNSLQIAFAVFLSTQECSFFLCNSYNSTFLFSNSDVIFLIK